MNRKLAALISVLIATTGAIHAQAWKDSYDKALSAAKIQDWAGARAAFMEAIAVRPEDQASATLLPGPVSEPNKWRGGAPYSPNFGAAYSSFKLAMKATEAEKKGFLEQAATGFEGLVAKGQLAPATLYFLNSSYEMLNAVEKQRELAQKLKPPYAWKVDQEFMTPEETGTINSIMMGEVASDPSAANQGAGSGPKTFVIDPITKALTTSSGIIGAVPVVQTKFALIIGNSETQMSSGAIPYAASDAMIVRDSLTQNAGYSDKNVDVVSNGTADQIRQVAKALVERMPENGVLLIYYTGVGVNVDGKDYLAGIDAAMSSDTSKMIGKEELFGIFRPKGVQIFSFMQVSRKMVDGRYFGMEIPNFGIFSMSNATSPGDTISSSVRDGKELGLYTKAFTDVLGEFRSNKVPITEFTWAVFQKMRGGSQVQTGGGSVQVPSMPILYNLSDSSRF